MIVGWVRSRFSGLSRQALAVAMVTMLACMGAEVRVVGPSTVNAGNPDTVPAKFTLTLTITPPSASVSVGSVVQLTSKLDSNSVTIFKPVSWATSDSTTVSVTGSGLATALKPGTATVTAVSGGVASSVSFSVSAIAVASVTITPAVDTLQQGTSKQLSATTKDANGNILVGRLVSWSSDNPGAVSVDGTGKVQALTVGSATITALSETKSGTASVVSVYIPVASVTITALKDTVQVGKTVTFTATTKDGGGNVLTGRLVTWTSSDTTVAKVNSVGQVTGRTVGVAIITALSEGQIGAHSITVIPVPVASVQIAPSSLSLTPGGQGSLVAVARDSNGNILTGRPVNWSSNNTAVVGLTPKADTAVALAGDTGVAQVTAQIETKSGAISLSVTQVPGPPTPKATDFIIRDTRAGHQNSIAGATTLNGALSAAGLFLDESCQSGNCVGPGFTTGVTTAGEHAFIWNIKKDAGNPSGCVAGGPSQQNWKIWLNTGAVNATGEIFLQYKYWSGQSGTGGGAAGNVGVFTHAGGAGGHKDVVWFRQRGGSVTTDGRFTMATESENASAGQKVLWDPVPSEAGTGSNGDIFAASVGVVFEKNNFNNQVVTVTYRIKPETSVGSSDGLFQQWMNNTMVLNLQNQPTGTLGWGEFQIGGPTWICPLQDETMYLWDIVVWQPR
jgi:uncharacterized protein YjdB